MALQFPEYDTDLKAANPRTHDDFPVGTRVGVLKCFCDFRAWGGERGTVVRNTGGYLGLIVQFDTPRREVGYEGSEHTIESFGFHPYMLIPLDEPRRYVPGEPLNEWIGI